ncbi:MAG: glycosyltransferase family 9 protein [Hyphomonadaceae bacterium]|nr:glycosyltransferase family 9 protein [Hyphomonadaceae bacterium]
MASVLFIAPVDLGEAVLATGALDFAARDGAATIVCGPEAAALFRAFPNLVALHPISADAGLGGWWSLWLKLAGQRFDTVIDARNSLAGRFLNGGRRIAPVPSAVLRHRVEEWTEWCGAEAALAPKVWLDERAREAAAAMVDAAPLLALAPGGNTAGKRWPAERFAAVARRLASGPLAGGRVALLGGARDRALIEAIAVSLAADGVPSQQIEDFDLLAGAAILERATLCIGNDNALTHLAAAVNAPTLTLFGPTDERVRAPYGKRARTLRGREYEAIMGLPALDGASLMEDISVDAVEAAAQDLLRAGGLL